MYTEGHLARTCKCIPTLVQTLQVWQREPTYSEEMESGEKRGIEKGELKAKKETVL